MTNTSRLVNLGYASLEITGAIAEALQLIRGYKGNDSIAESDSTELDNAIVSIAAALIDRKRLTVKALSNQSIVIESYDELLKRVERILRTDNEDSLVSYSLSVPDQTTTSELVFK